MSTTSTLIEILAAFALGAFAGAWFTWPRAYDQGWHEGWSKKRVYDQVKGTWRHE